jgi:Co/Zn/Cd efflux system component
LIGGIVAQSSALLANSLDNASDAAVYATSYWAVTRGMRWKIRAAQLSGAMLLVLSGGILIEVLRRFVAGSEPIGLAMMLLSAAAAAVNFLCLFVLRAHRQGSVDLRAAWTFSTNDFLSNFGALAAGGLVMLLGRAWPDLVVGLAIATVAAKGGIETLIDARRTERQLPD